MQLGQDELLSAITLLVPCVYLVSSCADAATGGAGALGVRRPRGILLLAGGRRAPRQPWAQSSAHGEHTKCAEY